MSAKERAELAQFGSAALSLPRNLNEVARLKNENYEKASALVDLAAKQNRDFTTDEKAEYEACISVMKSCNKRIPASYGQEVDPSTVAAIMGLAPYDAASNPANPNPANRGGNLRRALQRASAEEIEQFEELTAYLSGRTLAASNLNPNNDGGVLIPTFVQAALERDYAQFHPVRDVARIFGTDTGGPQVFPVLSDSETGEQLDPEALTGLDDVVSGDTPPTALTGPTLHAYKISSKPIMYARELMTDAGLDIAQELLGSLLARVTRFENARYTKGAGVGQAEGFLTNCSIFEASHPLDLDICLDLAYSVPQLYRPQGVYMMSDSTVRYLRKLKTGISGDKRNLWKDVFEEGNATLGTPAKLHGYPVIVNNDMSSVNSDGSYFGGTASPVAFGDFKRFVIREAENGLPYVWQWPIPAKDSHAAIVFRRSDSKLLVDVAIAKLGVSGS